MIPNMKRIVSDYLREEISARVVGKPTDDIDTAWVMVTQINAPQDLSSRADHLVAFNMQFDCYAGEVGGIPEANDLARAVRAALVVMDEAQFDDADVTAARIGSDFEQLDTDFTPARARWIVTATISAHATQAVS